MGRPVACLIVKLCLQDRLVQQNDSNTIAMLDEFMSTVAQGIKASSDHNQRTTTAIQEMICQGVSCVTEIEQLLETTFSLCDGTFESKERLAGSVSGYSNSTCSEELRC